MIKIDPAHVNLTMDVARTGYGCMCVQACAHGGQVCAHEAKALPGTQFRIYAAN